MKKLLLAVAFISLALCGPANADWGRGHGGGDGREHWEHDNHGWDHRGWDYHYFGHGWHWTFLFPPPIWFVPGITECREYYVQQIGGYDYLGNPLYIQVQHVECFNAGPGIWVIIR
jgi:hypothetical protein